MSLDQLNPSQRKAVLCTQGPLLVLAGAGSGKTRVITHRIARIISQGVAPSSIVAITFTNKAADEMRVRLTRLIGKKQASELVMGTFHALGVRMMRSDPADFSVPKRFSVLDQGDVGGIVRALLFEHGFHSANSKKRFDADAISQRISLWKNDFLDQAAVTKHAETPGSTVYDEIAAQIYSDYDERLENLGSLDFDDLVCRIAKTLRDNSEVQKKWSDRYRYILVDEYQDTSPAQLAMVSGLLDQNRNICVVGDDDQAIYGWRGAKVENILSFPKTFPGAQTVKIEENYRCRPPIVACANKLIAHNETRHPKTLIAQRPQGEPVTLVVCHDEPQESKWVSNKIRSLVVDDKVDPGSIAVLYRSSRLSAPIQANLEEHGIAFQVLGGQTHFDRKEIKDVASYFKAMVAPYDDLAIRRALETPSRGIGRQTIKRLADFAERENTSLSHAVHHCDQVEGLTAKPKQALIEFSQKVRRGQKRMFEGHAAKDVLRDLVAEVGLRDALKNSTGSAKAAAQKWSNVEWLFRAIDRYDKKPVAPGLRKNWTEFVRALDAPRDEGEQALEGVVTMATMHSSKGLEWPYVFIVGAQEGVMPHKRVESPRVSDAIRGDIEEERRLFYVGITRARDQLWITRPATKIERGSEEPVLASRFLKELPDDAIRNYRVDQEEQMSNDKIDSMAEAFLARLGNNAS